MPWDYQGKTRNATLVTEPIKAWRCWRINWAEGGPYLYALGVNHIWVPCEKGAAIHVRNPFSDLLRNAHLSPSQNCACGFWGLKTPEQMVDLAETHAHDREFVLGSVNLWGRVFEWTLGWRSQFAYPETIYVPRGAGTDSTSSGRLSQILAEKYKIDSVCVSGYRDVLGLIEMQKGGEKSVEADDCAA